MATVITRAFEHWQAGQVLNNLPARPDTIIFAHVPGLDPTADINPDEGIPANGQIVHRDAVAQYGMINDSAVAYSVVLDTRVGDFTFNWIGLVDAASNTLCMIVHTPAQQKIATANGVQGNNITRTFLMEFAGAAEASQITVSAQTWQIDFSARLRGIDEACRLANLDYYGHAAFFSDGFSVSKDGDKYRVKAGLAYVGGIRALLADDVLLEAAAGNVVYADVSYQGSVLSEFAPIIHLGVKNSAGDFGDYTDANGFTHYIAQLALITASEEDDKREANPFDKAIGDINAALKEHEKSRNHPDATLNAKGFTQLGSDIDSDSEKLAATLKAVKKAVNAGVTAMSGHIQTDNPHPQYLMAANLLSEIKEAGPAALTEALLNMNAVPVGAFGTLPTTEMPTLLNGNFNLATSGWCVATEATLNVPVSPISGVVFTWDSSGAGSTGLSAPPSSGVVGQKWNQILYDDSQEIYTRQRIGVSAWTAWRKVGAGKYVYIYPDGTASAPYTYPIDTMKEYANPFPGKYIHVEAEVFAAGKWGATPYIFAETSVQGIGISAHQVNGNGAIVVQSGRHLLFRSTYQGNPFNITATLDALPFRLRISNVGDL
ncbi:TPA: phage tail protein [Yersinia enterocolitica]